MLTHIVLQKLPSEATVESFWCVPHSGPPTWKAVTRLGFKIGWDGEGGGGHMTSLHMIPSIVGPSKDLLYTSFYVWNTVDRYLNEFFKKEKKTRMFL